jgi:hypothetical protein
LVSNANKRSDTGVVIKPEPDYAPQSPLQSPTASLKRQRSEEPDDLGEKRQRVESISAMDDDMGALFAQAAAAAARHIEESSDETVQNNTGVGQSEQEVSLGQIDDSTSDSRILARVLSLPMLESLVRCMITPW